MAGDPVDANSGMYWVNLPLMDLGGPIPLRYVVTYHSDVTFVTPLGIRSFDHNVPRILRMDNTNLFISPYHDADTQLFFTLSTGTATWAAAPDSGVQYELVETGTNLSSGSYYLMDPGTERVYIFEKYKEQTWDLARLRYVLDRNGNRLIYTYHSVSNRYPNRIEDGLGRALDLYYESNRVVAVTDHVGRAISILYWANNPAPRRITDTMGGNHYFWYDQGWWWCVTRWMRPLLNEPWTNAYVNTNYAGQLPMPLVRSQTDADGYTFHYAYDTNAYLTCITDPDSNVVVASHFHECSPPQAITDPASNTYTLAVTAGDQIAQVEDRAGGRTTFTYHESGFLETMTNALGRAVRYEYVTQSQTFTNPADSETVSFTFTKESRIVYPDGSAESFAYDERGNLIAYTNQEGHATRYQYNDRGWPTNIVNAAGGTITLAWLTNGVIESRTDSDGVTETFQYDALFRTTNIVFGDGTTVSFTYDNADRLTSFRNGLGQEYSIEHDPNGNPVALTDPANGVTRFAYDLMDRLVAVTNRLGQADRYAYDPCGRLASITDPNGLEQRYGYDARGWINGYTLGGQTWQIAYDAEGAIQSVTSPLGFTEGYGRDALGNPTSVTNPLGQVTRFTHDTMNRLTASVDALGRTNEYHYTTNGFLAGATVAGAGTVAYHRNSLGLVDRITDLNGHSWDFTYTPMGRLATQTDPLTNTWTFSYDACGRVAGIVAPDGSTLSNRYDAAGNVTNLTGSGGISLSFAYDVLGQLTGADGVTLERDAEGRVTNTVQSGISFAAEYDGGGRLKSVSYNNGALVVTYAYDPTNGLLREVSDNVSGAGVSFTFDADLRPTGWVRSNGVNAVFTWYNASRLARVQDGTFLDITYNRDAVGQVTQSVAQVPLDPTNGLTAGTDVFSADAACQLSSAGYAYDRLGRLIAAPGVNFTWDGLTRLTGAGSATLTYNGLNDLISRVEGGQTNRFFYNYAIASAPIMAEQVGGAFTRYYVWTPDGALLYLIDATAGNRPYYFHFDLPGSTLALTDTNGAVTDAYAYDPHGRLLGHTGGQSQPFTFLGRHGVRQEGTNGLYQMNVRYYDARSARFLSREPLWPLLTQPLMLNPYVYALNNPVSMVDPGGWLPQGDSDAIYVMQRAYEELRTSEKDLYSAESGWVEALSVLSLMKKVLQDPKVEALEKKQIENRMAWVKQEVHKAALNWWRKAQRYEAARKRLKALAGPNREGVRKALAWVQAQIEGYNRRALAEQQARANRIAILEKEIKDLQRLASENLKRRHLDLAERQLREVMGLQSEADRLRQPPVSEPDMPPGLYTQACVLRQVQAWAERMAKEEDED